MFRTIAAISLCSSQTELQISQTSINLCNAKYSV
jgi:hypothetical protein